MLPPRALTLASGVRVVVQLNDPGHGASITVQGHRLDVTADELAQLRGMLDPEACKACLDVKRLRAQGRTVKCRKHPDV